MTKALIDTLTIARLKVLLSRKYRSVGLTDAEVVQEVAITLSLMRSYYFKPSGKESVKCAICGERQSVNYVGASINERMQDHFNSKHAGQFKPVADQGD